MKILGWIIILLVALDALGIAVTLIGDGGPESDVWLLFLILPLLILGLILVYVLLRIFASR